MICRPYYATADLGGAASPSQVRADRGGTPGRAANRAQERHRSPSGLVAEVVSGTRLFSWAGPVLAARLGPSRRTLYTEAQLAVMPGHGPLGWMKAALNTATSVAAGPDHRDRGRLCRQPHAAGERAAGTDRQRVRGLAQAGHGGRAGTVAGRGPGAGGAGQEVGDAGRTLSAWRTARS